MLTHRGDQSSNQQLFCPEYPQCCGRNLDLVTVSLRSVIVKQSKKVPEKGSAAKNNNRFRKKASKNVVMGLARRVVRSLRGLYFRCGRYPCWDSREIINNIIAKLYHDNLLYFFQNKEGI